ncbi:MAG: isochorismatase family protein, partial [Candidatus Bathyarchaeia archaeon]
AALELRAPGTISGSAGYFEVIDGTELYLNAGAAFNQPSDRFIIRSGSTITGRVDTAGQGLNSLTRVYGTPTNGGEIFLEPGTIVRALNLVQDTEGAKFHPDLKLPSEAIVVSKAADPFKEAYSGFDGTELADVLNKAGVTRVFVGGLATDYCVKNTVLDARKLGFAAVLLLDAVRGINVNPGDVEAAIAEMLRSGAEQATLEDFPETIELPPAGDSDAEVLAKKPLSKVATKKKARMRPRGKYKRVRTEQ